MVQQNCIAVTSTPFSGLAVAGDPSFKTFEAAFPYVVRKLLSDNSVASRIILHSVLYSFIHLVSSHTVIDLNGVSVTY